MTDKPVRKSKGVWIPLRIWLDERLSLQEKAFLAEIESLDNEDGCWASNAYFAKHFNISKHRCSRVISSLVKLGFLSNTVVRNNATKLVESRILRALNYYPTPPCTSVGTPPCTSVGTPPCENAYNNSLSINSPSSNKKINKKDSCEAGAPLSRVGSSDKNDLDINIPNEVTTKDEIKKPSKKPKKPKSKDIPRNDTDVKKAKRIMNHLNKIAKKNFVFGCGHEEYIYGRLRQGYTYKDFIKVIETKQHDPHFIKTWTYMQASTLFSLKNFDNYLNEDIAYYKKSQTNNSNGSGYDADSEYNHKEPMYSGPGMVDQSQDEE